MDVLGSKVRTARKDHKCDYCGLIIPKGERYEWQKLKYDGTLYEWKSHFCCSHLCDKLRLYDDADDGGVSAEFFKECIDNEYLLVHPEQEECLPSFETRLLTIRKIYNVF